MRVRQEGVSPEALYEQGGDLIPATPKQFATLVYAESRKFGAEIEYPPRLILSMLRASPCMSGPALALIAHSSAAIRMVRDE